MKKTDVDIRLALLVTVLAALLVFTLRTEAALTSYMLLMVLWLLVSGYYKEAARYGGAYLILWAALFPLRQCEHIGNLPTLLVYARRIMIPFMAAVPISRASTGKFLATLTKLRIPRGITLSFSILFRFLPMIRTELRMICGSLRFRNAGRNPFRLMEYILIPLMIRTSKLADELSTAAMVRGIEAHTVVTSYRIVRWKWSDSVILLCYIAAVGGIMYMEYNV